ncbi:MAG: phosphoribosyltransferase family protein [Dehalococcoidia bacterium]
MFTYTGTARAAVLALKFGGVSALAPTMAAPMNEVLSRWSPLVDAVVPVPLGGLRGRTRGYSQAALLAKEVARHSGLPFEPSCLKRRKNTPAQTQQPDAFARRKNVKDAFEIGRKQPSGRVLLIDDVTTTGATLDASARALLDGGAKDVYCLTFARGS